MNRYIFASDLEIVLKMVVNEPYQVQLFDPEKVLVMDRELSISTEEGVAMVLVNFAPHAMEYIVSEIFDYIIDFGGGAINTSFDFKMQAFSYINNPDHTIRWIFPNNLEKPTFLNFYNSASIKAKLMTVGMKIVYHTPFRHMMCSGGFKVYYQQKLSVETFKQSVNFDNYSVFTGTVGPNRKIIFELNRRGKTTHFVKMALGKVSKSLVQNEVRILEIFKGSHFKHLVFPWVKHNNDREVGILSNIKPLQAGQVSVLTGTHIKATRELYTFSERTMCIGETSFYKKFSNNLSFLKAGERFPETKRIYNHLKTLFRSIDTHQKIPVAFAHADFTPWNTYVKGDKLYVYDWELSKASMPLLFDLFHFVFQSGVLLRKEGYRSIKEEINRVMEHSETRAIIDAYQLDIDLQFKLYLLINISYYLSLYEVQDQLHTQVYWLLEVWETALDDVVYQESQKVLNQAKTCRKEVIKSFTEKLEGSAYAILKFHEGTIEQIKDTSDLDILVEKNAIPQLVKYFRNLPMIKGIKVYQKSFMTTVEMVFIDNTFLSVDLIHRFMRKSLQMLDPKVILATRVERAGSLTVPAPKYDFEYAYLFYQLNGASIPQKYQDHFQKLDFIEKVSILSFIVDKYGVYASAFSDLFDYSYNNHQLIVEKLGQHDTNKGVQKVSHKVKYLLDTAKTVMTKRGFTVTFSGVDGAGKSTAIEAVAKSISDRFRRPVKVLRHRPSILPILSAYKYGKEGASKRSMERLPRTGTNTSVAGSVLRFGYYFLDYLLGQFYIYLKYTLRGTIVVYDRYYFDFINDGKRSNIVLPKQLVKALYWFILKPRFNFFLYAPVEVILNRKQELNGETIKVLTQDYKELFAQFRNKYRQSKYITVENIDLAETVEIVMEQVSVAS